MSLEKPPAIDFTGCNYSPLETALSNYLNLKVILVSRWKTPDSYHTAAAQRTFATMSRSQQQVDQAALAFAKEEGTALASLRSNIFGKDQSVAVDLSDNDLRSLMNVGHVTLRKGNTEPEQAVLIFDPGNNPYNDTDPVLRWALSESFSNAWHPHGDDRKLPVSKFIENFDISAEDKRIYQAAMNVRYALQNQSEYNNLGKAWYYEPFYYNFAGLSSDRNQTSMYQGASQMPFHKAVERMRAETFIPFKRLGIRDPELVDKLLIAGAIENLQWNSSSPKETFARLDVHRHQMTPKEIEKIRQDLSEKLHEKAQEHRSGNKEYDYGIDSCALHDWRVLFPVFREVYEQDKSEGPQREYYDTIMKGLQKWFPTLTNGPVPDLDPAKEPPRTLVKTAPTAPRGQKQPPKP